MAMAGTGRRRRLVVVALLTVLSGVALAAYGQPGLQALWLAGYGLCR
jgi:hypothetical protein